MKKTAVADLTLLFVVFIWGSTFVMVQNAIGFLEPHLFNAIRFFIAGILLFIGYKIFYSKKTGVIWTRSLFFSGIKIGIWLFLGYAFQTVGLLTTTPAKAGFITGLSVVLVPLFSLLLLKQKLRLPTILGVLFATFGLYFLTAAKGSTIVFGDVLVFFCAISFAMQIIMTAKYAKAHPALPLTIIQVFSVAILSFMSAVLFEDFSVLMNPAVMLKPDVWSALLVTAFLATAFAFFAQTYFQSYTSPTRVALIFAMEPVFAALTSFVLIGENLTTVSLIGCLFILTGMICAELPFPKKLAARLE